MSQNVIKTEADLRQLLDDFIHGPPEDAAAFVKQYFDDNYERKIDGQFFDYKAFVTMIGFLRSNVEWTCPDISSFVVDRDLVQARVYVDTSEGAGAVKPRLEVEFGLRHGKDGRILGSYEIMREINPDEPVTYWHHHVPIDKTAVGQTKRWTDAEFVEWTKETLQLTVKTADAYLDKYFEPTAVWRVDKVELKGHEAITSALLKGAASAPVEVISVNEALAEGNFVAWRLYSKVDDERSETMGNAIVEPSTGRFASISTLSRKCDVGEKIYRLV